MGLSTLNVVHLTYSTNASLLKNLRQSVYLGFLSKFYLSGFTVYSAEVEPKEMKWTPGHIHALLCSVSYFASGDRTSSL